MSRESSNKLFYKNNDVNQFKILSLVMERKFQFLI